MKLNKNFLIYDNNGETMLVPTGKADFSGIVRGNKTLGIILELLKGETCEEEIISVLIKKYSAPEDKAKADVKKALAELKAIGAIDE